MSEIEPQFKRIKLLNPLKFSFGGFRWAQQSTEIGQSASGRFNSSGQTSSGHNSRTQWPSAIESRPTRSVHKSDADQCNAEHRQKYNPYHFWRNLSAYFWNATAATRKNCLVLQSDRPVWSQWFKPKSSSNIQFWSTIAFYSIASNDTEIHVTVPWIRHCQGRHIGSVPNKLFFKKLAYFGIVCFTVFLTQQYTHNCIISNTYSLVVVYFFSLLQRSE